MGTVTNPPKLSSVIATFGGPNNLSAYVRGGAYVPNTAYYGAVSTTSAGLKLSQFAGLAAPVTLSLSPASQTAHYGGGTTRGTAVGTAITATATNGSGSYTYAWSIAFNPAGSIDASGICSVSPTTGATSTPSGESPSSANFAYYDNYTITCTVTDTVTGATATKTASMATNNTF